MDVRNQNKERQRGRKVPLDLSTMVYGKVPPQARDLEEAVLGAIMLQKGAFDIASEMLKAECFYVDAHQRIFNAMATLSSKSQPIDMMTVVEQLRKTEELDIVGGPFCVTKLTNFVTSGAHVEAHARIVLQKFIQREVIRIGGEMISEAYEDSTDVFDLLESAENNLYTVTVNNLKKDFTSLDAVMVETVQRIEDLRNRDEAITGVTSGFARIDKITFGWQETDLIIIAARPAVGKTAFALNIARNAALDPVKPTKVGVFSLEMSARQLVQRVLSAESEINIEKIARGRMDESDMERLYKKGIQKLSDKGIFIDDTPALNAFELRAKSRRMKSRYGVGLIVVDYLQLMSGTKGSGNREQEISNISRELKKLAKELEIPVIALSQLSREIEKRKDGNKTPQLSDLRESGAIEQDADFVGFLYGPEESEWMEDASRKSDRYFKIAKNRHGELDIVNLRFNGAIQKFFEKEEESNLATGLPPNWKPVPKDDAPFFPINTGSRMNDIDDIEF